MKTSLIFPSTTLVVLLSDWTRNHSERAVSCDASGSGSTKPVYCWTPDVIRAVRTLWQHDIGVVDDVIGNRVHQMLDWHQMWPPNSIMSSYSEHVPVICIAGSIPLRSINRADQWQPCLLLLERSLAVAVK